jgi:hypothetical protein
MRFHLKMLLVAAAVAVMGSSGLVCQTPPAAGNASSKFEQMIRLDCDLDKTLSSGKVQPGDVVTVHPRQKVKLQSGFEITPGTALTGHVAEVVKSEHGGPASIVLVFDRMEPRKGDGRSVHSTILSLEPAPDLLHPGNTSAPLDRSSIGVGPEATSSQSGPAQGILPSGTTVPMSKGPAGATDVSGLQPGTISRRDAIKGIDLQSNLYAVVSGALSSKHGDVELPAGTIFSLFVAVRPAAASQP